MDVKNVPKIETAYINLQSDFGFKRAFGTVEFRNALLQFLDAALGDEIKVSDVKFHNKEMLPASEDGKYEELFRAAESDQIAAEDVVPYSQSVERLRAYQAGIDYATEQSWVSGVEKGRAEGISSMIKSMYSNHMTVEAIAKIANISESEVKRIISCN